MRAVWGLGGGLNQLNFVGEASLFLSKKRAARTLLYTFEKVGSNPQSWPKSKNKPFHRLKKDMMLSKLA